MEYSVCIDALYNDRDVLAGLREVKEAGIGAVEFWSWWDKDLDAIAETTDKLSLSVGAISTRFLSLTDPGQHAAYLEGLAESIRAARQLGCGMLISQVGDDTGAPRSEQFEAMCDGLKRTVPLLEEEGMTLLIEPLNTAVDHQGYFLSSSQEAFDCVDRVNSGRVKVLFDIYHQQITEGDIIRRIGGNLDKIGHLHAAGNPGRHELDSGELDYGNIVAFLRNAGYDGYIGLEYFPQRPILEGLKRLPRLND